MANYMYYNLHGGVNLVTSKTNLEQSSKKVFWSDSKNVEIYKNNGIARMKGNTKLFSTPDNSAVIGMFEYIKNGEKHLVLNTSNGDFYYYNNDSLILKKSGLDGTAKPNYINYLNGVVVSNGVDEPFFFELNVQEEIKSCNATDSADKPIRGKALAVYKGRLWIGDDSTLHFSGLGLFDDWTTANDAGYIANFHNDSSAIVALDIYKEYLAIHKENQTYLLTGSSPDDFSIVPFANKGSVSPFAIVTVENKQYFFNQGVYTLEQIGELNQIRISDEISKNIHSEFAKLDKFRINQCITVPYQEKFQIWFYFPYLDNDYFGVCWIYDYTHKAWFKRQVSQDITTACNYKDMIYIATSDGNVLKEDSGNTFDGDPIDFSWESPFFNFGEPNKKKTIDGLLLTLDTAPTSEFNFSTCADNDTTTTDNEVVVSTTETGTLIWDVNDWGNEITYWIWSPEIETSERTTVSGSNYSFQLRIDGDSVNNNFGLIGFEFRDVLLDE